MKFRIKTFNIYFCFLFFSSSLIASELSHVMSYGIGMDSVKLTETSSGTTTTDPNAQNLTDVLSTQNLSLLGIRVDYEFLVKPTYSYSVDLDAPLILDKGQGMYSLDFGYNYFLGSSSSLFKQNNMFYSLKLKPTFRFFVGVFVGVGYVIYNTVSATKNDVFVRVGGDFGVSYQISKNINLYLKGDFFKGSGSLTSSFGFGGMLGLSTYL